METGYFSHAYIIAGPREPGLKAALNLAKAMLCSARRPDGSACGVCTNCRKMGSGNHPDLLRVSRRSDGKGKQRREIYVEQVRELAASAAILPNEAERKVYLIEDADCMNSAAQNALLKLLEDPPLFVSFLLVAENTDALLETVRSRCVIRRLEREDDAVDPAARELAERWLDLCAARSRVSLMSFAKNHGELSTDETAEFCRALRLLLTDTLCGRLPDRRLSRSSQTALLRLADRAAEYARFNVGTKHILGMLAVEAAALTGGSGKPYNSP